MSAGKRYKFQGSPIRFLTSYDEASPGPMSVSAITKANPAVVTVDSTTVLGATGDVSVVKFASVEDMTELGGYYIVEVLGATTFSLVGVDSSDYTSFSGTALAYPAVWSSWCEVTGLNRQGGSSPEIPASTVCSDFAEFEIGLPDFGTAQVDFNFAPETTVQQALEDFQISGERTAIQYEAANGAWQRTVLGFIQNTGEQGQNGALWTGSCTFRGTGRPVTVFE